MLKVIVGNEIDCHSSLQKIVVFWSNSIQLHVQCEAKFQSLKLLILFFDFWLGGGLIFEQ